MVRPGFLVGHASTDFERGCLPRTSDPAASPGVASLRSSILEPGWNCWRVEQAKRAAALVDAAAYFGCLEQVLRAARRSILIVGWDFDARIKLRPDAGDESPPLGDLLRSLVEAHEGLEIRILVWSIATLHAPGETLPLLIGAEWQDHPRIHLRLDREHPIYAAHHQKIVCIDDCLAFSGGIDLTVGRWDTPRHGADDPARLNPDGSPYGPVHDLQMAVDGAAARAVADLARLRWRHATGETLEPVGGDAKLWPDTLEPDFRGASLAIARTAPPLGDRPPVREVAALTMDALRAARHSIYIEAQYFVSFTIGRLLARHLASDDGPDIVIVTSLTLPGAFERFVMGGNRDRLIRRMKRADRSDRLRVYHPVVPAEGGEREVLIHAKLIIVDDVFVRIGSSNLNNRSVGLDTECDLAIEAQSDVQRQGVRGLRERLLGEHLGVSPQSVAQAIAANRSLVRAIDVLSHNARKLRTFEAMTARGPVRPIPGTWLLDPYRPFEPLWFLRKRRRRRRARPYQRQPG
jgi:phosphatidylserine/phosphatidylglycerophosphate/cardiolipin synthase-like enzyme